MTKKLFLAIAFAMISHATGMCKISTDTVMFADYITSSDFVKSKKVYYTTFYSNNDIQWRVETDQNTCYTNEKNGYTFVAFGSGTFEVSYVTISSSDIPGYITSVSVTAREYKSESTGLDLTISIGDTQLLSKTTKKVTSTDYSDVDKYTYSVECFNKGELVIEFSRDDTAPCAICCYYLIVEYIADIQEFYEESTANTIEPSESSTAYIHRSFSSDYWNTLCLPFSLSAEQISDTFGEESSIWEFESVNGDTLNFTEVDAIEAGTPYLFKPEDSVEDPYFEDVEISDTEPQTVSHNGYSFIGVYNATDLETSDVFIGTDGNLYHPAEDTNTMKGMRAYFQIPTTSSASKAVLNISTRGNTTGITNIKAEQIHDDKIYNMCGMFVGTDITALTKGVYIRNGKKIVIK